jgi:hypothetical protein
VSGDLRSVSNESPASARVASPAGEHPQVVPMPLREGALRALLERIQGESPSREAFLVEAVRAIATQTGAIAAAAIAHDPGTRRLRLVHAFGLPPEALPALCNPSLWNVPRRAMQERRLCVIDAAHQSPFVPKELVAVSPDGLSIAVIPFFTDGDSRVSLVLFAPGCNWFSDELLTMLGRALRLFARTFVDPVVPTAVEQPPAANESALLRSLKEARSENARLSQVLAEAERQRALEAIERVTAQSFLEAERQKLAVLEREIEALRAIVTGGNPDDGQPLQARDRAGLEVAPDGLSRPDQTVRPLADEARVRKRRHPVSSMTRSTEPGSDEPLGVVHITRGESPHEEPFRSSQAVRRAPAVVLVDSTEHAAHLLPLLEAKGCAPYVLDDAAAAASAAPTLACTANLTTPAAWWRVAALRSAWNGGPGLVGYVLPTQSDQGTWLGAMDVCLLPGDSARLFERLRSFVAQPSRVVLVSADPEVMRVVLEQMNAADVSTILVSQPAKVADLLPIARPEAAILHVSPTNPFAFAAIAAIRSHEEYNEMPILCLLDPESRAEEVASFDSGIRQLLSANPLPGDRLIEAVAATVARRRPA